MSTKAFPSSRVTSYPYQLGSATIRIHEAFLGTGPNGITIEIDPDWERIEDPNGFGFGSVGSCVNARPLR